MSEEFIFLLKLKTQKVQSFIFKVPKLKSMLGANSLLGEFFAQDLPDLRKEKIWKVPKYFKDLKKKENYQWETDDIFKNFNNGIIASAGGHFEAIFGTKEDAKEFLEKAIKKADEKIPGVRLGYHLKEIKYKKDKNKKDKNKNIIAYKNYVVEDEDKNSNKVKNIELDIKESFYFIDSPFFYPSTEDGENPGLLNKNNKKDEENEKYESLITKHIKKQSDKFYKLESKDYLSKWYSKFQSEKIYNSFQAGKYKKNKKENDSLERLKKTSLIPYNNMIAVIATDGNGMGNRFSALRDKLKDDENINLFDALIEIEKFWFNARNGFRKALKSSIENLATRSDNFTNYDTLPFVIMMLGGDDLLVVTVPELAFDFVQEFNKNLYKQPGKITSCSGIAFVKHSYPFSHAHELAENLLDSAKKLSKMNKTDDFPQGIPAVDWHFQYSSLYNDIEEIRERDYILSYSNMTEILSKRPYLINVTSNDTDKNIYLNRIRTDANIIFNKYSKEKEKGRNNYKKLRDILKEGRLATEHYLKLFLKDDKELFKYTEINNNIFINNSLDIIEILELNEREDR